MNCPTVEGHIRTLLVGVETRRDITCFDTDDFAFPQVRSKVVE